MTVTQKPLRARWSQARKQLTRLPWVANMRANAGKKGTYKYIALTDMLSTIDPVCEEHGFYLHSVFTYHEVGIVTLDLYASDDSEDYCILQYPFTPTSDPQAQGSAETYARRYSLYLALNIFPEKDDDGSAARQVAHGLITTKAWNKLKTQLTKAGYTTNDERKQFLAGVLGVRLDRPLDMTQEQAETVYSVLEKVA